MSNVGSPIYSQSGVGDESLLRVQQGENSALPPELAYGLRPKLPLARQAAADNVPMPDPSAAYKYGDPHVPDAVFDGMSHTPPPIGQRIAQLGKSPVAPQMDPRYEGVLVAEKKDSQPTDRTKPQYRMGIGGRILGTLANLFTGGIGGAVAGFIRPGMTPVYVGKGATNNRYYQDELARQQRLMDDESQRQSFEEDYNKRQKQFSDQQSQYEEQKQTALEKDAQDLKQYQQEKIAKEQGELEQETRTAQLFGEEGQLRLDILRALNLPLSHADRLAYIQSATLPANPESAGTLQKFQQAVLQARQAQSKPPAQSSPAIRR